MAEEFGRSFATLPMGQLICGPIIAVAQGQSELCRVYLDYLFALAFREGDPEKGINSVKFKLPRQIVTPEGDTKTVELEVEAPAAVPGACAGVYHGRGHGAVYHGGQRHQNRQERQRLLPGHNGKILCLGVQLQRDREGDHVP